MNFWLDRVTFSEGLRLQEEAYQKCLSINEASVLGLEHEAVITLGKRLKNSENDVKALPQNIALEFTDRGGEATIHSPGQLVVYPVLNLKSFNLTVRCYVRQLERVTQSTLKEFGIESNIAEGKPGLYTENGKIAFVGIRVRHGITQHGLSLNVSNDLSLFQLIRPCGMETQALDSMQLNQINATPKQVFEVFCRHFHTAFYLTKPSQLMESCSV